MVHLNNETIFIIKDILILGSLWQGGWACQFHTVPPINPALYVTYNFWANNGEKRYLIILKNTDSFLFAPTLVINIVIYINKKGLNTMKPRLLHSTPNGGAS